MDVEKLITETFTEHEHVVPDSDAVLAAARQRIDRRRTVSRPLAAAAGVAVLILAAVTVVALNRPADNVQVAAPADNVQTTSPVNTAAAVPGVADLQMPYSLEWLPPGEADYLARRINIGGDPSGPPLYGGEYMLTITADGQVLNVDVQQFKMVTVDEATFKSGPGSPVTINGQRAVESSISDGPGGYELYVEHPDGGTMYVNVSGGMPVQQLVDNGRRIAENIRFPGTTTVTPAFGLGDLPGGLRICAFSVGKGFETATAGSGTSVSTSYSLGSCDSMPPIHINLGSSAGPEGTPGSPVQGHETRYVNENGYHRLWVLDAVNGAPVYLAGKVPVADLYDIANRLVLPS